MGALPVVLAAACAVLALAVLGLALNLRRARRDAAARQADLEQLGAEIAALTARQNELETRTPAPADYVIGFDDAEHTDVPARRVVSTTLGEPLIKVAAFGHGVRYALREESRAHLAYQVRREYRRRRKATRRAARTP